MASSAKSILLLLMSLGVAAVIIAMPGELGFYQKFIYCLVYNVVYGWAFYVPFVAGYAALSSKWNGSPWLVTLLGAGTAAVITAPVWASSSFPAFSGIRFYDAVGWTGGGAFYGLLHQLWITKGRASQQVGKS